MRKPLSVLAVIALTGTMTVALAGTAGAKGGGGSTTTTTPKVAKVTTCQVKTAQQGITQAMTAFLTGGSPAVSMKYIDQGSKIGQSYQESKDADTAAGLTSPSKPTYPTGVKAQCVGKTKANFTYDLYIKDLTTGTTTAPLGLNESGNALIKKGVWYVSASTVCDLTDAGISSAPPAQLAQVTAAATACYQAIGQTLPPAS